MYARRLLMGGGDSFTVPVPDHAMTMVAYLTRLTNVVINEDTAFSWSDALTLDAAYATWTIGDPTKLYIEQSSWFWVGADITTLGTSYGGADNADWLVFIGKNGITLNDSVIGERHRASTAVNADLMSVGSPVYLEAGDYIQLYLQNANAANILVESNPSDGPTYTTDTGPGTMSPHLFLIAMNGSAPV